MEPRVMITVVGTDRIGIIAGVANTLAEMSVNIVDIRQTIVGEFFTMILVGELYSDSPGIRDLQDRLNTVGNELGVKITVQSEEIFRFIHRI